MGTKGRCKFEGCSGEAVGKGYCARHYRKWKRGDLPKARYKTCRYAGCLKRQQRGGRCEEHQKRKRSAGGSAEAKES